MMHMNWGKGIIIGMSSFMLFIIGLGTYMFMAPTDEVDQQYYEKGLAFNKDYNREEQVVKDHAKPSINIAMNTIILSFTHPVKGKANFNRPADGHLDRTFAIESNQDNEVVISLKGLMPGQWQLALEWTTDNKQYLYHQEVFIP